MQQVPKLGEARTLTSSDRWLLNFLTFAGILYGVAIHYSITLDKGYSAYSTVFATILVGAIVYFKALFSGTSRVFGSSPETGFLVLLVFLLLAMTNLAISWDKFETSVRWGIWLGLIVCLTKIVKSTDGSWLEPFIYRLPFLFIGIYFVYINLTGYGDTGVIRHTYHMSGLYGNLVMAVGLFAPKVWMRLFWLIAGFLGVYYSGSGGALFTVPIMFMPFILYSAASMPVRGVVVTILFGAGALVFFESDLINSFLNRKLEMVGTDIADAFSGRDRLTRSKDQRIELIQYGIDLARDNPFGTGLGHTYKDEIAADMGVGHAHNGPISSLIELGFPGFTMYMSMLVMIFWKIFRNNAISNRLKGFYFTYYATIFGRSLSENYTPFDLGNFFNILFLTFTAMFFLYPVSLRKGSFASPQFQPQPMPIAPRQAGARRPVGIR